MRKLTLVILGVILSLNVQAQTLLGQFYKTVQTKEAKEIVSMSNEIIKIEMNGSTVIYGFNDAYLCTDVVMFVHNVGEDYLINWCRTQDHLVKSKTELNVWWFVLDIATNKTFACRLSLEYNDGDMPYLHSRLVYDVNEKNTVSN